MPIIVDLKENPLFVNDAKCVAECTDFIFQSIYPT